MDVTLQAYDDAKRELTTEVIRQFGEVRLKVTGSSMLPSIWPGDVIAVRRKPSNQLHPGRILLCYRDQKFVAHRFLGQRDERFFTRGDSLSCDDSPFRDVEILGEVYSIHRNGRGVAMSTAWWHPMASRIVRHSDLCARLLPRLRRLWGLAWAH